MYRENTSLSHVQFFRDLIVAARACFRFLHLYRNRANGRIEIRNTLVTDCFCCCDIIIRVVI